MENKNLTQINIFLCKIIKFLDISFIRYIVDVPPFLSAQHEHRLSTLNL